MTRKLPRLVREFCSENSVVIRQNLNEFSEWLILLRSLQPRVGLEIGRDRGGSAQVALEFLPTLESLISVDVRDCSFEHPRLTKIISDSTLFETRRIVEAKLDGRQLDFLLIDGDHSILSVTADFYLYHDFVRQGGFIGIHDIVSCNYKKSDEWIGPMRFWWHLTSRYPSSCSIIGTTLGIGVFEK